MSATTAKKKQTESNPKSYTPQVVTLRPNLKSIYFNNNGLFSENYLVNRMPSETRDSFVMQHWQTEDLPDFNACYEWMLSAWDEFKDILPTLSEAQLEDKWIRPILERLGWTYEVQDRLKRRGKTQIPDYSLFDSLGTYKKAKGCQNNEKYFSHVLAVADAKAMGVDLDGKGRTNSNPSFQIVRYMEDTGTTWGILTDGEYWRLYSMRSKSRHSTFYEVNIRKVLAGRGNSARDDFGFKYFFNFFRQASFSEKDAAGKCFLDVVYESGERYAREVETQLKDRAFRIVEGIAKGFVGSKTSLSTTQLAEVYQHSLYYLFRLLFVLNCESRGILEVNDYDNYFPYSLRSIVHRLKEEFERNSAWSSRPKVYEELLGLFELLEKGDTAIKVFPFGKELFGAGHTEFYRSHKIPDSDLNKAIVELACAYGEDGELQFIDYGRLGPDHIGSIFEGLLEYSLKIAEADLWVDKDGRIQQSNTRGNGTNSRLEVISRGSVYLTSGSGERKVSGAYYTPDSIVDYIVAESLAPLCEERSPKEILELKICDPAMGSGHFLIGAIRYLERRILEKMYATDEKDGEIDGAAVRWQVLHNCVFGIDINPIAVELAKFSLWIFTVRSGHEVEPLSDQLFTANALIDPSDSELPESLKSSPRVDLKHSSALSGVGGKFDVIIGNPPYAPITDKGEIAFYNRKFGHQEYQLDLYLLFLERYAHYLKPRGILGIIVSNTWLQSVKLRKIRSYLCCNYRWLKVLHSEDKLFSATVDTHALIFQLGPQASLNQHVEIEVLKGGKISSLHKLQIDKIPSNGDPVNLLASTETGNLFKAIQEKSIPLGELCNIYVGVKPFQKGKGRPKQTAEVVQEKPFVVEGKRPRGSDWMPLLRGSLINRYKCFWNNDYWIKYGEWLAEPRSRDIFDAPEKLVVRQTGDSIIATYIGAGFVARNNLHIVTPKKDKQPNLYVLLGIMNSALIDFAYYNLNPEKGEALAEVKKNHVEQLPVLDIQSLSDAKRRLASQIEIKVKELLVHPEKGQTSLIHEIDHLVFELYGLSPAARKTILDLTRSFKTSKNTPGAAA